MLVAMVTALSLPAWATIWASLAWYLAFSTWWGMPARLSLSERYSLFSTLMVPTSRGRPVLWTYTISLTTALNLPASVV